ncbi:MAG: hypothetical protein PHV06_02515 [bacterium]|mgnify:CR=1 FL=1|nr:hypothetical protein [bacterium]
MKRAKSIKKELPSKKTSSEKEKTPLKMTIEEDSLKKEISGGFQLSLPQKNGNTQLSDRQVDLIYFMTTVIAILGLVFGKEIVLRLLEILIQKVF